MPLTNSPSAPIDSIWALMTVWKLGGKIIRTVLYCVVLCCVRQLCTMIRTHTCEQFLNLRVGLGIDFVFVYLFRLIILCDCFVYCCVGCSCCVGFHFLSTKPRDCQGRTSPKRLILCLVGRKTLTQSINQANKKLAPYGDWRSTLRNWRLCQLQSRVTQKLGRISKIRPDKI